MWGQGPCDLNVYVLKAAPVRADGTFMKTDHASMKQAYRIMLLQVGFILAVSLAVGAATSRGLTLENAHTAETRRAIRLADEAIQAFSVGLLGQLGGLPSNAATMDRALGFALGGLARIQDLLPDAQDLVTETQNSVRDLAEHGARVRDAASDGERRLALEGYLATTRRVSTHMDFLDARARDAASRTQLENVALVLGGWGLALVVYLLTAWWARRLYQGGSQSLQGNAREVISKITHSVATGEPSDVAPARDGLLGGALLELAEAAQTNAGQLAHLRSTLELERSRSSFSYHVTTALDLADSEAEVCRTFQRAAQHAFPSHHLTLLLADNSRSALEPQIGDGTRVCDPSCPTACPAVRWGRVVRSRPQDGMARCPRLLAQDNTVTCTSVAVRGHAAGVAQLVGPQLLDGQAETLQTVVMSMGARLGVVRSLDERELQASTDALTGLANRRAMNEKLHNLDLQGKRYTLLAADLDHFKRLNDTYGHDAGDSCLKLFAQVLKDTCRGHDIPCRPGGEEFLVILPETSPADGAAVGERVRQALRVASHAAGRGFTASFGVAGRPVDGDSAEGVLKAADQALYAAKDGGRDRVVISGIAPPLSLVVSPAEPPVAPDAATA